VSFASNRFLRAVHLFWEALGPRRVHFAIATAVVLLLAVIGVWHLIAPATKSAAPVNAAVAGISPGVTAPSPSSNRNSPSSPTHERAIAITEITEAEERGPRGETFIVAKIGMSPRTAAEKENIEIRVLFFDVDANNEMRPTDAQVTYEWITPVRDWTDPAPKYLAATYLKPSVRPSRRSVPAKADRSSEQLRYGGFLVRVYCDGKLQDERSKPDELIAALRSDMRSLTPADVAAATPTSQPFLSRPSPSATELPSAILDPPSPPSDLPKGIPVSGKPGFVQSPYDPKFLIDVRGFPPGTLVNDPNTNKPFRVP
jgi:hypothetical protein